MPASPNEVTQLLAAWRGGDEAAADKLMPLVYDELRRRAGHYIRAQPVGHTLQATALIHEAFLKLVGQPERPWQDRTHFVAVAAQAMRQVLVDYARSKNSEKRAGQHHRVSFDEGIVVTDDRAGELVRLDDALHQLAKIDPRKSRVVVLRYFGGLSNEEVAGVLNISAVTVIRDWRMARTWLRRELTAEKTHDS